MPARLRTSFFSNLFVNLALLLGAFQVLVWHWWQVAVRGEPSPSAASALAAAALLVAANGIAFPLLRRHRRRGDWRGWLSRVYMNAGIVTLLLGVVIAALWLIFLLPAGLLGLAGASPEPAFGLFRGASVGAVGLLALFLFWGFTGGQARVARTHLRVELPGLDPALDGLRIVHVSDLHIGNRLEGARLARMVERVNAEDGDLVVITGDIFDFDPAFVEDGVRELSALRARHGVYAILGNHDVYTGVDEIVAAFARLAPDVRLLRDESVRLPLPAPLHLAGVEDPGREWAARGLKLGALERLAAERPDDGPTVLLVHRPEALGQAARLGFPLVLAGHTHGGQLALPTPRGEWNLARFVTPLTRGVFRRADTTLYVNRGLGVGGPALRFNCPREIATIELAAAIS
jgi:predicted MPP superfamily phosphohydrolase